MLTTEQKSRYERNLLVSGFSEQSQECLLRARVAVVGAGGLGSAALGYLVAVGVGHVTLIENDVVSISNLQRQLLYATPDVGEPKAEVAAAHLSRLNPMCSIRIETSRLTVDNAEELLAAHDVVVDCTDNYQTRYVIDDFCAQTGCAMVYGTAQGMGGQVAVFHAWQEKTGDLKTTGSRSNSYRSLYPVPPEQQSQVGVLSPIVGVIGSMQAMETVKLLTGLGDTLAGRLLVIDASDMQIRVFDL